MSKEIPIGDVFRDRRPPRGRWRVTEEMNGVFVLVPLGRPAVSRFHPAAELLDPLLYMMEE